MTQPGIGHKGLKRDAIGIGGLLLGVPPMLICAAKFRGFFSRKPEVASPGALEIVLREAEPAPVD